MDLLDTPSPSTFSTGTITNSHNGTPAVGGWSSLIGITTAIIGNVLISFALNTQRYAHLRLSRDRKGEEKEKRRGLEVQRREGNAGRNYGTQTQEMVGEQRARDNAQEEGDTTWKHADTAGGSTEIDALIPKVHSPGADSSQSEETIKPSTTTNEKNNVSHKEKSYLQSPIWWLGIGLMVVGEAGNFLAYGFAPASIVSPLGVVALISNCIIAPLVLGERFRWRDGVGVIIAVAGCVTVVLSASDSNPRLTPDSIWNLITRWEFETYLGITTLLIVVLIVLSNKYGDRTILIDLGLVGLFGGYTALSTKGIASLLSNTIWRVVTFPITYLLVVVLVFTAVMQIKYINRALQHFNATVVIPTQFVMFTLSVIIGSAVLYRDFERETAEEAGKFVGGCALTFLGVWCITSGRSDEGDGDEELGEEDGEISLFDEESVRSGMHDSDEFTSEISPFTKGAASPFTQHMRSAESNPPSLIVTQDSQPDTSTLDRIAELGPAQYASIHSNTMSPLPKPSQSLQRPPTFHATTSAPVVPTKADLAAPAFRPRTPLNRYSSTPANASPASKSSTPQEPPRLYAAGLLPGPLTSPLSSSLAAIVADSLRRGVDSPSHSLRRKSSHRRRPRGLTGLSTLDEQASTAISSGKRPSLASETIVDAENDGIENTDTLAIQGKLPSSPSHGKSRSRSLSATLGNVFGSSSSSD